MALVALVALAGLGATGYWSIKGGSTHLKEGQAAEFGVGEMHGSEGSGEREEVRVPQEAGFRSHHRGHRHGSGRTRPRPP